MSNNVVYPDFDRRKPINSLQTMLAELDEGIALARPHYPNANDNELRGIAMMWRPYRYAMGEWPTDPKAFADWQAWHPSKSVW